MTTLSSKQSQLDAVWETLANVLGNVVKHRCFVLSLSLSLFLVLVACLFSLDFLLLLREVFFAFSLSLLLLLHHFFVLQLWETMENARLRSRWSS